MPSLVPLPSPEKKIPVPEFVGSVMDIGPVVTGSPDEISWQVITFRKTSNGEVLRLAVRAKETVWFGNNRRRIEKNDDIIGQVRSWSTY